MEGIPNEDNFNPNDTFILSRNSNFSNLGDSNFFSTYGDKSMVIKQFTEMDKQIEDDNKSNFTIELDLEKQVDSLLDEDDDLNDAKYLENDKSYWSSTSNILSSIQYNNNNQHNMTTPIPIANNILTNQIFPTNETDDKLSNNNNNLTSANSTTELNKKLLEKQNNNKNSNNKELNISILGDKYQDTLTGDSNNNINNTGNIFPNWNNNMGFVAGGKLGENLINMTQSNTSSFEIHSNSFDLNNINKLNGFYYKTPNNSLYYNQKYYKNNSRYNKFQQNYSQSQYLQGYYLNGRYINNIYDRTKTFNNMNNINFSELSSRNSVQSLNIHNNKRFIYNNYNKLNNNYINNMKTKMREDSNRSYNENLKLMLKDQKGSKFIQKKIEEKSHDFLFNLYEQIKNNLYDIMTNQYGNYVIQKFLDNCDKKLISKMLKNLSQNSNSKILYEISINNYGTRPLQKMIENLSNNMTQQDINILLNLAKGDVLNLIKDINGNRIFQCIIQNIKNKELLSNIYKEMNENIVEILKIKSGCCVFSKILSNIVEDDLNNMVDIIINNIEQLINDEYGNISLKRIIKLNNENYNNKIFDYIKDILMKLSCQKFSSNVIEACIDNSTSLKRKVLDKIFENDNNINELILDQFGNYIVQNALLPNAEKKEFDIVIQHIKDNEKKLKKTQHGKIIFEKLMKNYKRYLVDNKQNKDDIDDNNTNNYVKIKKQVYHNNGKKNKNKSNVNKKNKK